MRVSASLCPIRGHTSGGHDWLDGCRVRRLRPRGGQSAQPDVAAFGSDSLVELLSACIVLLQFRRGIRISALVAARLANTLLVLLAGMVVVLAILTARFKIVPERSFLGIGITLGALIMMPILAYLKRRHANKTSHRALAADAVQSATCAYLAAITLLSLVLQTIHAAWWIDSVAAVCLIPILLIEARRAWRGEACGCC